MSALTAAQVVELFKVLGLQIILVHPNRHNVGITIIGANGPNDLVLYPAILHLARLSA